MTIPDLARDLLALPPEGSSVAGAIDALHLVVIGVTICSSVVVALLVLYFVVRYRRVKPGQLTPKVEAKLPFELGLAGGTLALFLGFWTVGYLQFIDLREAPDDATPIYVTAKQWMWTFTYPGGRSTNDTLMVPSGRSVKLVMTSRDVIHSFYVPGFRIKQDVVPGRYVTTWFQSDRPGRYPIYCAEYCGISHSMMLGEVVVMGPGEYEHWIDGWPSLDESAQSLAVTGRDVAVRRGCVQCHTFDGQAYIGPTWSRLFGSYVELADGRRVKVDEGYLTRSMMDPSAEIVRGYPNVMPGSYRATLTQPEVGALVALIKALKDGPIAPGVVLPRISVVADAGAEDAAP